MNGLRQRYAVPLPFAGNFDGVALFGVDQKNNPSCNQTDPDVSTETPRKIVHWCQADCSIGVWTSRRTWNILIRTLTTPATFSMNAIGPTSDNAQFARWIPVVGCGRLILEPALTHRRDDRCGALNILKLTFAAEATLWVHTVCQTTRQGGVCPAGIVPVVKARRFAREGANWA